MASNNFVYYQPSAATSPAPSQVHCDESEPLIQVSAPPIYHQGVPNTSNEFVRGVLAAQSFLQNEFTSPVNSVQQIGPAPIPNENIEMDPASNQVHPKQPTSNTEPVEQPRNDTKNESEGEQKGEPEKPKKKEHSMNCQTQNVFMDEPQLKSILDEEITKKLNMDEPQLKRVLSEELDKKCIKNKEVKISGLSEANVYLLNKNHNEVLEKLKDVGCNLDNSNYLLKKNHSEVLKRLQDVGCYFSSIIDNSKDEIIITLEKKVSDIEDSIQVINCTVGWMVLLFVIVIALLSATLYFAIQGPRSRYG